MSQINQFLKTTKDIIAKRWTLIIIVVGCVAIVGGIVFVVVTSQQKEQEELVFQEETLEELERQLPLPEEVVEQRQSYVDPQAKDKPGDYQAYWGDQNVDNYGLERTQPTTATEQEIEVETVVRTVFPILFSHIEGEDTVDSTIGVIADYLTPELTEQLIDEKEQTTYVNNINAEVDTVQFTTINDNAFEGQISMTFIYYSSRIDPETEEIVEETIGQEKKSYTFEVINKDQYWYISAINE